MGYRRETTIYKLEFAQPEFNGLEVYAKSVSIKKLTGLMRLSGLSTGKGMTEDDIQNLEGLFEVFGKALVKWNLEEQVDPLDDDSEWVPVPATADAVLDYDDSVFMTKVVLAWVQTIASVSDDLGKDSTSGQRFPEGSGQMDLSSLDLESLMKQIPS